MINSKSKSKESHAPERAFKSRPESNLASRTQILGADLASILNSTHPLVVEIGCGVGLHPIRYATEFPEKNIIAIERTSEKFARFAGRLERHPNLQKNLCAVNADAIHFIDQNFQKKTIDEVWILYPNPEIKKTTRRWFQTPFMSHLRELMKPGAALHFATNLDDYANDVLKFAPRFGFVLQSSQEINRISHAEWKARTHFEKKYHERGETLFDFVFRIAPIGVSQ